MSNTETKRKYRMSKRAESAAQTERSIFEAAAELWIEKPFADITLDSIAERAGVSVRTVIRKYGSKEGLYEVGIQAESDTMKPEREEAEVGNIESAIEFLLKDYETYGDAVIRTLAVEEQLEAAKKVLKAGRDYHRNWCSRIFEPFLSGTDSQDYEDKLSAFVAATDIYVWKLLCRDLDYGVDRAKRVFIQLVRGLV